ncbi:TadE/TadG family type IV pilus assembly protein [Microvirga arabica]|uniref:TadE/TadG family type IV pilus assembly protein n=1 Tax=Microvirga arabica TaxID=1128671 RepID=UPI00193ABC43|nr:TadE/TadG family type IV pilus assembly protein [Microvirga arabica]MBM1172028.1 pilus assembly protein [Microvirga arabica]
MLAKIIAEFRNSEQGAAIVETAIVAPLAILILAGGFEIGRGLSVHHAADKAVRNAARYLARVPATSATEAMAKQIVTADDPNLADATVTMDATRFTAGVVSLTAVVPYKVTLLSAVFSKSTVQFTVAHEQPYVGE